MSRKVFVFQGDSITDGCWSRNGDPNHILGHGFAFYAAAFLGEAHPDYKFYNRGISGNSSWEMRQQWDVDVLALHPEVLTVLVGINDCLRQSRTDCDTETKRHSSLEQYEENIRFCLTEARKQDTNLKILLGIPFYYRVSGFVENMEFPADEKEYDFIRKVRLSAQSCCTEKLADIAERQKIVRKIAADFHAELLDFPALFTELQKKAPIENWVWDGVHPTVAAHGAMGREWLRIYSRISIVS